MMISLSPNTYSRLIESEIPPNQQIRNAILNIVVIIIAVKV